MKMSKVFAVSPVSPSQWPARMRWPVDDTGMNSVTPSTRPRSAALSSGSATIRAALGGYAPQGLLVQGLVHRHDAVGGEGLRLGDGRLAHRPVAGRVPQQLHRPPAHGFHRADRLEDTVH